MKRVSVHCPKKKKITSHFFVHVGHTLTNPMTNTWLISDSNHFDYIKMAPRRRLLKKKPFLQNYVSAAHNYFSLSRDITGNNIISAFIQQCVIILMDRLDLVIRRFGRSHPRRRLRTVSRPSRWSQRENCPIKPPRSVSLTSPPPHRLPNRLLLFTSANRMRIFAERISAVIYFIYTDLISGPIQLC